MKKMSKEEYTEFLTAGTKTGKLATVRDDGRPHVVPVWYVLDGDHIIFNTATGTVKAKNMMRDPRVSLSVDDQTPPYSYVTVEGTAELIEDAERCLNYATRIGGKYMGKDRALEFGERNSADGELIVKITPRKVMAYKNITDY